MSDEQERAMEHDELMTLHQANAKQAQHGPSPAEQARLLETVVESDLTTGDPALTNLRAKDFPLSNYEDGVGSVEFKWVGEIIDLLAKSERPHSKSGLTGLSRAWATGDTNERKEPLNLSDYAIDEAFKLGAYSRAVRGESGFQQEISSKQVTESHAIREDSGSSGSGGILGRFRK